MTRQSAHHSAAFSSPGERFHLDPYFACLILIGVGVGSLGLPPGVRLPLLWLTMGVLWLVYYEGQVIQMQARFGEVGRGMAVGAAIGLPLLILAYRPLAVAIPILYIGRLEGFSTATAPQAVSAISMGVFVALVIWAPLSEALFFRHLLRRQRGLWVSVGLYAANGVMMFLPAAGEYWIILLTVSGVTALLGGLYAFLDDRYGLTTSLACHITINLFVLFFPIVLSFLI